jgi:hypothetical protein
MSTEVSVRGAKSRWDTVPLTPGHLILLRRQGPARRGFLGARRRTSSGWEIKRLVLDRVSLQLCAVMN